MRARLVRRNVASSFALLAVVIGAGDGCRTATQVTLSVNAVGGLTCADLNGIDIVVAATAGEAETRVVLGALSTAVAPGQCEADGHTVGTLSLIPGGSAGAIFLRARVRNAPETSCAPPTYRGCIVARRVFSFIEHADVTLPIALEAACEDVPCDVQTSCRSGACVDSSATCSESSGTCTSAADPEPSSDAGRTALDGASDATRRDDASEERDARADAADATTHDASDADAGRGSNPCPTTGGTVDCTSSWGAQAVCCGGSAWTCAATAASCPSPPRLPCTGALYCASGTFCCGSIMTMSSSCTAACVSGGFLCGEDKDCPTPTHCTGSGPSAGMTTLRTCQ